MNEEIKDIQDDITIEESSSGDIDSDIVDTDENGDELSYKTKIKSLQEKLKQAEAESKRNLDGWQRSQADAINKDKQFANDRLDMQKYASKNVLMDMIPVMDSFLMAMKNKEAWEKVDTNWRIGVEYIKNQLQAAFEKHGLTMYGNVGDKADPTKYSSIESVDTDNESVDGTVADVFQVGYMLSGKVIREAKVKTFIFKQ